ncbi:MAG: choice-of-anchor D domain-containing protein [Chloroflexota bacterium]
MPAPIAAVFVSSTWVDLQPERAAVEKALNRFYEAKFIGMEYFGSREETTRAASLDEVDRSQLYIGIFAGRYGSGITEAEYRRARERQLECLIYFKADSAIEPTMRETDAASAQRLIALKEELRRHTATTFSSAEELAAEVTADVHRWLFDKFLKERLQQDAVGEIVSSKTGEAKVSGAEAYRLQVGSTLGGVLYASTPPVPQRRATPLLPNVRRFRGLIDRADEVQTALAALPTALPVEIDGPTGVGKTVLMRTLAYHPELRGNPDGVVYLDRVGTEAIADLQQCLYDSFYQSAPRLKPSEGELRQLLRDTRALILLDDVAQTAAELESLFNLLPNCLFCLASEERHLHSEVKVIALAGLPEEHALALIERELGTVLSDQDRSAARQICNFFNGNPSQLILAVASARQQHRSLAGLVAAAETAPPLDKSLTENLESRSPAARRTLAVLAILGASVSQEALAACMGAPAIEPLLQELSDARLIQTDGARFSLSRAVANAARALPDGNAYWLEALPRLVNWTEQLTRAPESLLNDVAAIERATQWAADHAHWQEVLRLARAAEPTLSGSGRWAAWGKLLDLAGRAAVELHDDASRAWALHELGSRAICLGDPESADRFLRQALALRIAVGDHWDAALTQHNLDILRPPTIPSYGGPEQPIEESREQVKPARSKFAQLPRALKFTGIGLIAVAAGLIAQTFLRQQSIPFKLNFSPPRLEFTSAALHQPSSIQSISVTNPGARSLTIGTVGLSGSGAADFTVVENGCEAKLLPGGGACDIALRFTPSGAEPSVARLIFCDGSGKQTADLALRGEIALAPAPLLSVRPAPVDFGEQEIGSHAGTEITIASSSDISTQLSDAVITGNDAGDFSLTRNNCREIDIGPQSQCTINLTFSPRTAGPRRAALVLTTSDGGREEIALLGTGISRPVGSIRVEPAEVEFGELEIRRSAERQITLVHSGAGPVEIGRVAIVGGQSSDFKIAANGCQGIKLDAGRRCILVVSFTPDAPGRRAAILIIADDTPDKERRIPLIGHGRTPLAARLEIVPELLDFGERGLNLAPLSRRLMLRNSGMVDVRLGRAAIVGADARNFSITFNSCGARLARGASCGITVGYRPAASGAHDAVLRIEFDDASRDIELRGRAAAEQIPIAAFTPTRLDFGDQPLRSRSRSLEVTVQNRGSGELLITGVEISGSSSFAVANRCAEALRAGASCSLRVTFAPRARSGQTAELLVSHNAAGSPQHISLSGVATLPATANIDVVPNQLQFGNQMAGSAGAVQAVTVASTGAAPLAIRAVTVEGANAGDFTMSNNCVAQEIPPGGRCQISLRFAPKTSLAARAASASHRSATLVIHHNAATSPRQITIEGTAVTKSTTPAAPGGLRLPPDSRILSTGWCCANGILQQSTRAQCAEKNGSFFTDQQSAQSRCIPVIR